MKMGDNFTYKDNSGTYEVVYCFKLNTSEYDGGINHTSTKGKRECFFFNRKEDKLSVYNINGYDRVLSHFPKALIDKIMANYIR